MVSIVNLHPYAAGVRLDLGGVAKGVVLDTIRSELCSLGFQDVMVVWGGDVACAGAHPARRGHEAEWRVALDTPPSLADMFQRFSASARSGPAAAAAGPRADAGGGGALGRLVGVRIARGSALAVSGDYSQPRKFGHHHVVDPRWAGGAG